MAGVKDNRLFALRGFQLAASLDEADACAAICDQRGKYGDPWWVELCTQHSHSMRYPFHPGGWSARFHLENKIPVLYLVALSHTTAFPSHDSTFKELLGKAKKANESKT